MKKTKEPTMRDFMVNLNKTAKFCLQAGTVVFFIVLAAYLVTAFCDWLAVNWFNILMFTLLFIFFSPILSVIDEVDKSELWSDFQVPSILKKIIKIIGIAELVLIPVGGFLFLYFADKGYLL